MSEKLEDRPLFVRRHGKGLANVVTEVRQPLSLINAIHTLQGKTGFVATSSNILTDISDTVDGLLAKSALPVGPAYGKIGDWLDEFAQRDGALRDRKIDKRAQNIRRAALVLTRVISPVDCLVPMARDYLVDCIRDTEPDPDTTPEVSSPEQPDTHASSSINIGRAKTVAMALAFAYSATKTGRKHPESIRRAHRFCTYFSVVSGGVTILHETRKRKQSKSFQDDSLREPSLDMPEAEAL